MVVVDKVISVVVHCSLPAQLASTLHLLLVSEAERSAYHPPSLVSNLTTEAISTNMNIFRKNHVRNDAYDDPAYGAHTTNPGTYGTTTGPALDRTHPTATTIHPNTGIVERVGTNTSTGGEFMTGRHHRDSDLEYGNEKPRHRGQPNITSGNFNRRPKFGQW